MTFLPDYQVEAEMEMTLTVQEFTDNTYLLEKEVPCEQLLCPEMHPLVLSPTCSLLSFYNRVDVTYHRSVGQHAVWGCQHAGQSGGFGG